MGERGGRHGKRRSTRPFRPVTRPEGPGLAFQKVDDPTPGKNRVHIDFTATDVEAEVGRLVGLGATETGRHEFGASSVGRAGQPGRQRVLRGRAVVLLDSPADACPLRAPFRLSPSPWRNERAPHFPLPSPRGTAPNPERFPRRVVRNIFTS